MPAYRHCRHCWGNCDGECLLPGDTGACIHVPSMPLRRRVWLRLVEPAAARICGIQNSRMSRPRVPPASRARWASAARSAGRIRATRKVTWPASTCCRSRSSLACSRA